MKKIRDHVVFGDSNELSKHISQRIGQFEAFANQLWNNTHLEEGARVFPNILHCVIRQLQILEASPKLPLEAAAGACRTVFEVYVRTKLMTERPQLIREFWVERAFEEISLLEAFKRLAHQETPASHLSVIDSRVSEIRAYISKWKLQKPSVESTFKLAESAGLSEEYKALYGFYSKYTHGSAWLVNAGDAERDGEGYRMIFTTQTQFYAEAAFECIRRYAMSNAKG